MTSAAITGWGLAVPAGVVTNDQMSERVPGVDPAWIAQRTGILQRHLAGANDTTSSLATAAGRAALARADVAAESLDLIIVATCTPDRQIPGTAPAVQAALGATNAGAFDINAACAGFLTALGIGDSFVRAGAAERVLVIGAELLSRFLDWTDPKTCVLFGDGAGAVVLERDAENAGLRSLCMGADGEGASLIQMPAGGSARPATTQTLLAGEHTIRMSGQEVFRAAVRIMSEGVRTACAAQGMTPDEADLVVLHQANQRIIDQVALQLGLAPERVFSNVARFGNTSAASVPIALCEAAEAGLLHPGARVVLSAVGAGLTWASGVVRWTGIRAHGAHRQMAEAST